MSRETRNNIILGSCIGLVVGLALPIPVAAAIGALALGAALVEYLIREGVIHARRKP